MLLSNRFVDGAYVGKNAKTSVGYSEGKFLYFRFDGDDNYGVTSLDTFKSWLSNNKTILCFVKDIPTEEFVDVPSIQLEKGTNIITIGTKISPQLELSYYSINN